MAEQLSRRTVLGAAVALVVAACSKGRSERSTAAGATTTVSLKPTPSCGTGPTVAQTEGPYFKPNSPEKSDLYADVRKGTRLVVTGSIVSTSCQPGAGAKLDFWQADGNGNYDNSGYTLRGWQLTDANGAYRLETVIPGLYPGRTEHIHFKVTVNGQTYTSQLFFPGVSQNEGDSIYSSRMLVTLNTSTSPVTGTFTFVVNVA